MTFIIMPNSINETRKCIHCQSDYQFMHIYYANEKSPDVFVYSETRNQIFCPVCGKAHTEFVPPPHFFEKRPTLNGLGREILNKIKKRNYGSTMPDY